MELWISKKMTRTNMKYPLSITKMKSLTDYKNEHPLRTDSIEGWSAMLPETGRSFVMYSKSLDPTMDVRQVTTSQIQRIEKVSNTLWYLHTLNSIYAWQYMGHVYDVE